MIDTYRFGMIVINGRTYKSDVIISGETVNASWWRKEGHRLCIADIDDVLSQKPDTLIIGTGSDGVLVVPTDVKRDIEAKGIEVIVQKTPEACETYNILCKTKKVIAALHLTC